MIRANAQMRALQGQGAASVPQMVTLALDGEIVPFTRVLRGEDSARAARYRAWKLAAGLAFRQQWGARDLLGKGLWISIDTVVTVAAARLWSFDGDNAVKAIADSMIGVVLTDDRYVSEFRVTKVPARPVVGVLPGVTVFVEWRPLKGGNADG